MIYIHRHMPCLDISFIQRFYIYMHTYINTDYIPMHDIAYVLAFQCTKLKQYTLSIIIYIRGHAKKTKKKKTIRNHV